MTVIRIAIALFIALAPLTAAAYIGPGSGISLLGGIWSVLVAVVLALAAILFWPIRLMIKRMKNRKSAEQGDSRPAAPGGDGE
jgi:membrane protein implicated in regulation of membrane protease activity